MAVPIKMLVENHVAARLDEPVIHAGVVVRIGTETSDAGVPPFHLETIAHDGAYAVSFGMNIPEAAHRPDLRVVLDIAVESGAIGVGCLNQDFSAFVNVERVIKAGGRRKICVEIGSAGAARHFVLRNASHEGASVARVYGIDVRPVHPDELREVLEPVVHAGLVVPLGTSGLDAAFRPLRLETIAQDGAYAVSFGLDIPESARRPDLRVAVEIEVEKGAIGIGCLSHDFSAFVDVERVTTTGPRRNVYVPIGIPGAAEHVMFRNASHEGASVARVFAVDLIAVDADHERQGTIRSSFWEVPSAKLAFPKAGGDPECARRALAQINAALRTDVQALTFPLALTHTSRVWDLQRCAREFLRGRYQRPRRLDDLPPFEALPPARQARSYSGRLTLCRLTFDREGIKLTATRCIDSEHKIQHACKMDDKFVICFQDYMVVLPAVDGAADDTEQRVERIDDPWFSDIHTVFPIDASHCVLSAAAPDALMVLDLKQGRVVRRWRVPSDRYGRNYELTATTSVHDHFIANDMQLAHLNCAFPDGNGGFWISTLGQGDIGHVFANGDYELIATGFVGCHGIRYSRERDCLYFSDSCTGRLISIGADRVPRTLGVADSRWLHDAQHLARDLFVLCLGDKNAVVVLDTSSNSELARFDMKTRGENVQFVNRVGEAIY